MKKTIHENQTAKHSVLHFLFKYWIVKLIILLSLHLLGAFVLAVFVFVLIDYLVGVFGFVVGHIMTGLWISLKLNFLPPVILSLSLVVISIANPIYALAALIIIFLMAAIFLLGNHIEFLALIYVIVYIGAIAILFLFVIMMFNLKELKRSTETTLEERDFITLNLFIYLITFSKFYSLLVTIIYNFIEYDVYLNEIIALQYKSLFNSSFAQYQKFLKDVIQQLKNDLITSQFNNVIFYNFPVKTNLSVWDVNQQLNENLLALFKWYLHSNVFTEYKTQMINSCENASINYELKTLNSLLTTCQMSFSDISIVGQIFYTYHAYLFLLGTIILLVSMVGAIVLALSTKEKKL